METKWTATRRRVGVPGCQTLLAGSSLVVRSARDGLVSGIGGIVQRAYQIGNYEGWISGTAAADLANVNARRGVEAG